MSNVILLDKGAVQTDRARPPTKQAVTNICPSRFSNSTSRWYIANNGAIESGAFCVDDGQVIPLELLQDSNSGGTENTIIRYEHNASSQNPDWNDLGAGKICLSFYCREAGLSYLMSRVEIGGVTNYDKFDLSDGSILTDDADTTVYVTAVTGGWRIEVVWDWETEADGRHFCYWYMSENGVLAGSNNSDGTSSVWIGGIQIEHGVERASRLVKNDTSAGNLEKTRTFGGNVIQLNKGAVQPTQEPSAVLSGTIIGQSESEIVDGGKDIVLTLDGATWQKPAWRNIGIYSNDPSSAWNPVIAGGAKVQNAAIAPNGLLEATEFFGDEAGGTSGQVRHAEGTRELAEGQLYRYSIYIKNSQGDDWLRIGVGSLTGATDIGQNYFDITNGAPGVIAPSGVTGIESAALTFPNSPAGWSRIWGHVRPAADVAGTFDMYQRTADGGAVGNRDNNSYFAWGWMCEAVEDTSGRPSDLIETAGASVTFSGFNRDIKQAIIDGLNSDGVEAAGWNALVRDVLDISAVVRTSDLVVTVTLPAVAGYDIDGDETITATIPIAALNNGIATIAAPTFTITATVADLGAIYTAQAALSGGTNRQAAISGGSNRRGALTGGTNRRGSLN